jgi:hypothetical protein
MSKPTDGSEKPDVTSTDPADDAPSSAGTSDVIRHGTEQGETASRIPLDLVSGLFLLSVVAVFVLNAGDDPLDWIFPLTLSYTLAIIGIYLTIRGLLGFGDKTDTLLPVLRGRGVDVLVFTVIAAIYVALARPIGFWTMSALMLFAGSVYLDPDRSRKRIGLSAGVAVTVCLGAYLLLVRLLYVPIPPEGWLSWVTG